MAITGFHRNQRYKQGGGRVSALKTQVIEIQNSESIAYRHVYHVPDSTK